MMTSLLGFENRKNSRGIESYILKYFGSLQNMYNENFICDLKKKMLVHVYMHVCLEFSVNECMLHVSRKLHKQSYEKQVFYANAYDIYHLNSSKFLGNVKQIISKLLCVSVGKHYNVRNMSIDYCQPVQLNDRGQMIYVPQIVRENKFRGNTREIY